MSRQLAIASAFSVLALSALALCTPAAVALPDHTQTGAAMGIAAPAFSIQLPLAD